MNKKRIIILSILSFVFLVLLVSFIFYKNFNEKGRLCEIDSDCMFVASSSQICWGQSVINKNYLSLYKIVDYVEGIYYKRLYRDIMCDEPGPFYFLSVRVPYCTDQGICSIKVHCEKTCERLQENSDEYIINKQWIEMNREWVEHDLKRAGCNCTFD